MSDQEKHVDEAWKENAALDKERLEEIVKSEKSASSQKSAGPQQDTLQEGSKAQEEQPSSEEDNVSADFLNYIASLGYQAMIFMGEIPNPLTKNIDKNLDQAKFLLDTLIMLKTKTHGNLNKKEEDMLNTTCYELQMKYVDLAEKEEGASKEKSDD